MRRFLPLVGLAFLACSGNDDPYFHEPNEIVFGVSQSFGATAADSGRTVVGDYDYLTVARTDHGPRPWIFTDGAGDGTCYYERFDERVGHAPSDPGVGIFTGGMLPAGGLSITANQATGTTLTGVGWASNDVLRFHVSGFAMPVIPDVELYAPTVALDVTNVTPPGAISANDDVAVTWTPTTDDTRVMVALDTDGVNATSREVRCFTGGSYGRVVIPHAWVAKLFASVDPATPITGRLRVASHAQVTVAAPGNWLVYVVATSIHHDAVFTGTRN